MVALCNGEELNYANVGSDAGVPVRTLEGYFSILEETLLGFMVPAFLATKKRKAITRPKFYLFDVGVTNLLSTSLLSSFAHGLAIKSPACFCNIGGLFLNLRSILFWATKSRLR